MSTFVGRAPDLARLAGHLERVRATGQGAFLAVRGRRQVGKSRLLEEFIARSQARAVFYVASRQPAEDELEAFRQAISASPLDAAEIAQAGPLGSWEAALTLLGNEATKDAPIIIVIDELPYLVDAYEPIEAVLQKVWDRTLERKPVLLVAIGSDLAMMEMLTSYGRPLHGRLTEQVIEPLSPADTGEMLGLDAAEALDAYLVIGGFPRLAARWRRGETLQAFLAQELADAESPLVVLGERVLNAEFPAALNALAVAKAIGHGERTFTAIARRTGLSEGTLSSALQTLEGSKRLIRRSLPYSVKHSPKLARYTIADPYLRFWLSCIDRQITTLQRGRGDVALERFNAGWSSYRGKAIEPVVRAAIERMLPDPRFGDARFVGGFWNRDNSIEVDLVGGTDEASTSNVEFSGSIKWIRSAFGRSDLAKLVMHRGQVPGASSATALVGVSLSGFDVDGLDVQLGPEDIVAAFGLQFANPDAAAPPQPRREDRRAGARACPLRVGEELPPLAGVGHRAGQ